MTVRFIIDLMEGVNNVDSHGTSTPEDMRKRLLYGNVRRSCIMKTNPTNAKQGSRVMPLDLILLFKAMMVLKTARVWDCDVRGIRLA